MRRSRRQRKTRYRKARWQNRRRGKGWLAPSLESRIAHVLTWVQRLRRLAFIVAISQELVKFDLQAMDNPEISGVKYQQGTLAGYEVREYLLEKWKRMCAYCGKKNIPLQEVLKRILAQAKAPLKDAAAVNTTRWALSERLKEGGLPVEYGSGGLTKFNRSTRNLPKMHWLDAANVGKSTPEKLQIRGIMPLRITANGHGCRQMCLMDETGFPRTKPKQKHFTHGFRTGDIVRAIIPAQLNHAGVHVGRLSAKAKGGFTIATAKGKITGVGKKYCRVLQRADGYGYAQQYAPTGVFLSSLSLKA